MAIAVLNKVKHGSSFAKLFPLWGKGDPVIFWAAGGRVHCRDERPNTPNDRRFNSIHWREMAQRVQTYSEWVVTYKADGPEEAKRWRFERERAQKWMEDMIEVLREARSQCDIKDDQQYVSDRRMAASRLESGDHVLAGAGERISGAPVQKRIVLPDNMQ
jgi:hypothetical protein